MMHFEMVRADQVSVKLRHIEEGHQYEFGFVRPDGRPWHEPHLIWHTEGDGSTGTGLAGQYLEQARAFAISFRNKGPDARSGSRAGEAG